MRIEIHWLNKRYINRVFERGVSSSKSSFRNAIAGGYFFCITVMNGPLREIPKLVYFKV